MSQRAHCQELFWAERPRSGAILGEAEQNSDYGIHDVHDELSGLIAEFAASEREGWFYRDDDLGPLGELGMREVFVED